MTQDSYDVIVIGGGYAGVTAANRLPRGTRAALIDPKNDFIHRVRLHEFAAGGNPRVQIPFHRMLRNQTKHLRSSAAQVEPGLVQLADGKELRAKHILLTTGSDQAAPDSITAYPAAAVTRVRVAQTAPGTHVVVLGTGLTGIELAAELAYRRQDLTIHLHGHSPIGANLPAQARDYLRRTLERLGVRLDSEGPEDALCIDATGVHVSSLARASTLDVSDNGQMLVAPTLEGAPGVWGAGDAVRIDDQPHLRPSCAAGIPMGAHAADNIIRVLQNESPVPFDFGYSLRCISLGRRNGLIVKVDPFDTPTGKFTTGTRAAWIKSIVCAGVALTASSLARTYKWAPASRQSH